MSEADDMSVLGFCFILLVGVVVGKHDVYDGNPIYKITVQDIKQSKFLNDITNQINADVWTHALPGRPGLVMVEKQKKQVFEQALEAAGLKFRIEVENVKDLLDLEDKLLAEAASKSINKTRTSGLSFDKIYTYEEVDDYLQHLAEAYPNVVTLVVGGHSFEGRPIKYLKISSTNFQDHSKPIVYMQSLLHCREWISLPTTLYAIEKLVVDVQEKELIQDIDWIILPIANPDGYIYTHVSDNRLWRKNRATGLMVGDFCVGVDLNRNFGWDWGSHSSNIVCSDTFHGKSAFSEPETQVIRDIIHENSNRLKLFLDMHSFGSMILYGYGSGELPPNGLIMHLVGVNMAYAIDSVKTPWNQDYVVGNVAMVLYEASGSAMDYARGVGVPLTYTFELPGFRYGLGTGLGFLVDPDFIEQAGFETWEGIKAGARFTKENFNRSHIIKEKYRPVNSQ